ncbi:unnamed protein product [Caretta caretta]
MENMVHSKQWEEVGRKAMWLTCKWPSVLRGRLNRRSLTIDVAENFQETFREKTVNALEDVKAVQCMAYTAVERRVSKNQRKTKEGYKYGETKASVSGTPVERVEKPNLQLGSANGCK